MNDESLNKLFADARAKSSDTSCIQFGFETRLLARLRGDTSWVAVAWQLVPVFAAVVVALGVWNYASGLDLRTGLAGLTGGLP